MQQNIFYGDNAQGKTNILLKQSISVGQQNPTEVREDRDMIQFGKEESHIEILVEKDGIRYQIDVHLKKNTQRELPLIKFRFARQVSCSE